MGIVRFLFVACVSALFILPGAYGQSDETTPAPPAEPRPFANHSPRKALFTALVIPGGGQFYNKQYWKLPIVYAGLGGMTYLSIQATSRHRLYTRAFQYRAWQEQLTEGQEHPFPEYEDEYNEVLMEQGRTESESINSSALKSIRDKFRRNRDLSRFGIGLVYGLSIIDAFVSAHLLDFDVSEDLTVQVLPHPEGATARISIGL